MNSSFCGLDFGTSNSTLGIWRGGPALVALEDGQKTIPSALFFGDDDPETRFGRHAVSAYVEGEEGRLIRSLKSVLGSSLMAETTLIGNRRRKFTDILGLFIRHLKNKGEEQAGCALRHVVVGRPVYFVDGNPQADALAQNTLEEIVRARGFDEVAFQYEPVAAALDYEQKAGSEKLALIIDIGGGTSDFSVIRVSPDGAKKSDRFEDVLANEGIHTGGTDLDKILSLKAIMPHLGYRSTVQDTFNSQTLTVPNNLFHDLATWHKINFLYNNATLTIARDLVRRARQPVLLARLVRLLEWRTGHSLAFAAEQTKIDLASAQTAKVDLSATEPGLSQTFTRAAFDAAISADVDRLRSTMLATVRQAGIRPGQLDTVFLTGGSTAIPKIAQTLLAAVPQAQVVEGDRFASVGTGLTLDAKRRFG